jgi:hypothetical protein
MKKATASVLAWCLLLAGCGYISSGEWSDDPQNWSRAFGESRPADGIEIVHSWYMRTPHWTAEFAWFFELQISETVRGQILKNPELKRIEGAARGDVRQRMFSKQPEWFLPKSLDAYDAFQMGPDDFLIFMERGGNRSFWSGYQL